jgi:hypothetical protein
MIVSVAASFKRSAAVREKRRLQVVDLPTLMSPTSASANHHSTRTRLPKHFKEINEASQADPATAAPPRAPRNENQRDHLPPAAPSLDTYTLLKVWYSEFKI